MAREIQPYSFEPEYSDTELTSGQEESSSSDLDTEPETIEGPRYALEDRVGEAAADWCLCGMCQPLPTGLECQCCGEASRVIDKRNETGTTDGCISTTERFSTVCLDQDVIHITLLMIHDALRKGPLPNPVPNRSYRLAAYRQFTYWVYGKLGRKNRIPIPACVVRAVRDKYPEEDGNYEGYHEATYID